MLQILKNWADSYFSDEEAVYLLVVLVVGALVIAFFGGMLAPVLTAIVLAYLMQGLVNALERHGMRSLLAINLVFVLFMGMLVSTLVVLLPMVWRQTLLLVRDQLPYMLKNGEIWLRALPERYPDMVSMDQVDALVNLIQKEVAQGGQSMLTVSLASIPNLVELMVFVVLVPLLVYFFLKDKDAILNWVISFLPRRRRILSHVWQEMDGQIANYVRGKAIEILLVGATTFVCFLLLGMHYTVLLAVLVGLSVVVPYIGATVVTLPVAAVAYVQFGWSGDFALVMLAYGIIQFIDGNILVPLLFSEAVNLHPVAIITAILLFGGLWGLWGVFFAIPLATLIKAVINAWPRNEAYQQPLPEASEQDV
ncbi:permease PerM [Alcanivorax hongdengensis A-11-3]|uniref:Permease PerM n=1 Tax=Alcanivorax hongdengensis A-11-3 TaxID=1177179 RepID=L0WAM2_9GAMM|nr:AI-2E family transporter [Alcanivorax hongdengensis]EKF74006.1 permease PerM [Alcanivorax hongdengensis A-11-3]